MATFKVCVQKERKDGFYPVYIRITHRRTTQYIKTDKMLTRKELTNTNEIKDPIGRLASALPDDIPDRSIVMFKIVNLDKNHLWSTSG